MRIFIYACEQRYGGLHGIEDFCVEEFDDKEFSDFEELDEFIWDEWITEMSLDLAERHGTIEYPEDENDFDEESLYEVIDGYWCYIKENIALSTKELNKEACRLGAKLFKEKYCEENYAG